MRRGFVPLDVHAAIEPIAAVLLIAAPWIFQFSDVNSAKIISIVVGVIMLLSGAMTRWRFAIVRVIPLRTHFMTDLLLGVVLIVSPFVFGFSGNGAATRFMIVARILELMTALATRWEPVGARDHKSSSSRMALRAEPKFRHQRLPEAHSVSEMSSGPSRRAIAIAQAAYYVPTAIAPFVSRRGFESITGPNIVYAGRGRIAHAYLIDARFNLRSSPGGSRRADRAPSAPGVRRGERAQSGMGVECADEFGELQTCAVGSLDAENLQSGSSLNACDLVSHVADPITGSEADRPAKAVLSRGLRATARLVLAAC